MVVGKSRIMDADVLLATERVVFWKPPAFFGPWTLSAVVVDGMSHVCPEPFMMA